MNNIINSIEELTKSNGKTGKELGIMLGLKKSPLTDWKNGKSKPTLEQIIKICDIFAISADALLNTNQHLDPDEQKLIEYYRHCSVGNKAIILNAAEGLSSKELQDTQNQETKSSDLKIG